MTTEQLISLLSNHLGLDEEAVVHISVKHFARLEGLLDEGERYVRITKEGIEAAEAIRQGQNPNAVQ